jgi:hypothetical protein
MRLADDKVRQASETPNKLGDEERHRHALTICPASSSISLRGRLVFGIMNGD